MVRGKNIFGGNRERIRKIHTALVRLELIGLIISVLYLHKVKELMNIPLSS